ncbi:MAG: tRNA 2-selenouridine(34) synthase MnmH [Bacteroidia bacterium]|nr:tRNA 2-selenouridine(34) synthase MnmH [Bacteroidia bacterium]
MKTIGINFSLISSQAHVLVDVRSEGEFAQGHIPGAVNLPLLRNEERVLVGTTYKKEGNQAAVLLGYELVGPRFRQLIEGAISLSEGKPLVLHCWRGGLRSRIMAQLLSNAGLDITIIEGGYKTFRNLVLNTFLQSYNLRVLGGFTGSGKTEMLKGLANAGKQIIDLEELASHRGSAFGAIGMEPQPTQEQFENNLALLLSKINVAEPLWLEDEASMIGKLQVPDVFFKQMRQSPLVVVRIPKEERFARIRNEYGVFPKEQLIQSTQKIAKKLGDLRLRKAISDLENNNFDGWLDEVLFYYDKVYVRALNDSTLEQKLILEGSFDEVLQQLIHL